jgi:hypothetical protein
MDSMLRVWPVGFQSNFTLSNFSEKNVRPLAVLCVAARMHDHVRPKLTLLAAKGTAQRTCLCSHTDRSVLVRVKAILLTGECRSAISYSLYQKG